MNGFVHSPCCRKINCALVQNNVFVGFCSLVKVGCQRALFCVRVPAAPLQASLQGETCRFSRDKSVAAGGDHRRVQDGRQRAHTHTRTHAHTRTHRGTHTCVYAHTHTRTHTHTHAHTYTPTHTQVHARIHTCKYIRTRAHTCTHVHTRTHTRTHRHTTHTRTHTHTHTHAHAHAHVLHNSVSSRHHRELSDNSVRHSSARKVEQSRSVWNLFDSVSVRRSLIR